MPGGKRVIKFGIQRKKLETRMVASQVAADEDLGGMTDPHGHEEPSDEDLISGYLRGKSKV